MCNLVVMIPIIAAIVEYFNEHAGECTQISISDIALKKYGFYEMMFTTHICHTLRVYFEPHRVHMVWTRWTLNNWGQDREVETSESRDLLYGDFATDRLVAVGEFEKLKAEFNKIAQESLR